jgi:uncharacterized glyoxalase superfamily protein PhnB
MEPHPEPTVALSLTVKDTSRALEFYTKAPGAAELFRMPSPNGGVGKTAGRPKLVVLPLRPGPGTLTMASGWVFIFFRAISCRAHRV